MAKKTDKTPAPPVEEKVEKDAPESDNKAQAAVPPAVSASRALAIKTLEDIVKDEKTATIDQKLRASELLLSYGW